MKIQQGINNLSVEARQDYLIIAFCDKLVDFGKAPSRQALWDILYGYLSSPGLMEHHVGEIPYEGRKSYLSFVNLLESVRLDLAKALRYSPRIYRRAGGRAS